MSMVELKKCYESRSPIEKSFSYSIKNKESLNKAMKTLQVTHFHLLWWCATGTGMCHFLHPCVICNDSLVSQYDTLVSCNNNSNARYRFFYHKNIYRLKLTKDLRDTFVIEYLRKVDISTALVTVAYGLKRN